MNTEDNKWKYKLQYNILKVEKKMVGEPFKNDQHNHSGNHISESSNWKISLGNMHPNPIDHNK